jgi:CheY-like chemotaxis protein
MTTPTGEAFDVGTERVHGGSSGMSDPKYSLVLLVEDEVLVRIVASEALHDSGFDVLEAADADDALALLKSRTDIGLLFTDVNLPGGLDGLALAAIVHSNWPDIRIVVTSGRPLAGQVPDSGRFLSKPYSLDHMAAVVAKEARKPLP